ncbi:MAG: anion permease, partial [bacterium]
YFYSYLNQIISIKRSKGPLFVYDWTHGVPLPSIHPKTTPGEIVGVFIVVTIGCLMAFSSGTSNIANAIAPLVGSGNLEMNSGIILGCFAVGFGSLTIGRRTLETLGNDLTELPLTAAIIVATVSATIIIILSSMGIPASFVVVATTCIIGLGWGRATRPMSASDAFSSGRSGEISVDALTLEETGEQLPDIGEEKLERVAQSADLFEPGTTARVILLQNFVPLLASAVSYLTFQYLPFVLQ